MSLAENSSLSKMAATVVTVKELPIIALICLSLTLAGKSRRPGGMPCKRKYSCPQQTREVVVGTSLPSGADVSHSTLVVDGQLIVPQRLESGQEIAQLCLGGRVLWPRTTGDQRIQTIFQCVAMIFLRRGPLEVASRSMHCSHIQASPALGHSVVQGVEHRHMNLGVVALPSLGVLRTLALR